VTNALHSSPNAFLVLHAVLRFDVVALALFLDETEPV